MTNLWLTLLFKSTVILAVGWIAALLLRNRPAALRHLVWLATLCALLILPLGLLIPRGVASTSWTLSLPAIANSGSRGNAGNFSGSWESFTALWAAGVAVMIARLAIAGVRALGIVNRSEGAARFADGRVRFTNSISTPAAWSFGSGSILLPRYAANWTDEEVGAAVRHEAAHLRRKDCQALLAAELARAVYWINPLVWYAVHRLRLEQEHAADDCVLREGMEPAEYASRLVQMLKAGREEQLLAGVGTRSMLAARVEAILDEKRRRTMLDRRMLFSGLALMLAVALPLAAMQAERRIYKIGDGVSAPSVVYKVEPRYTQEAREAKISGTVGLAAVIEADGRVTDITVVSGLDDGLDRNAVETVGTWVFKPAEKDGAPVAVSVRIEINFKLL